MARRELARQYLKRVVDAAIPEIDRLDRPPGEKDQILASVVALWGILCPPPTEAEFEIMVPQAFELFKGELPFAVRFISTRGSI